MTSSLEHRVSSVVGHVVLLLHTHLPYVLFHGRWPHGSEWLYEAACETYIPLLNMFHRLEREGKAVSFTIDITPILCEMLESDEFRRSLKVYIQEKVQAASADLGRFRAGHQEEQALIAAYWGEFYEARLEDFTRMYNEDLLSAFRQLQELGQIELITSAATHAYLPLLDLDTSVSAQISQGVETYRRCFGREPRGIWLPECGYRPSVVQHGREDKRRGIETFLSSHGLMYSFLDGHHFTGGPPGDTDDGGSERHIAVAGYEDEGQSGSARRFARDLKTAEEYERSYRVPTPGEGDIYRTYRTGHPETGECAFFARDGEASGQVWSSAWGYPGDPWYLEFHKKQTPSGLRYWRVTDRNADLGGKRLYETAKAEERVRQHAHHFRELIQGKLKRYREKTGRTGVLTIPFDAELFGHWWFEGIEWLYELVSAFSENCDTMISQASAVLLQMPPADSVEIGEGSWGQGGGHHIWDNRDTAWTWALIHRSERYMCEAVDLETLETDHQVSSRILKQMARELFLMQSSDWQFLITTKTAEDYGRLRFSDHYEAFENLRRMITAYAKDGALEAKDVALLSVIEDRDAVFRDIRLEWFKENKPPVGGDRGVIMEG